MTKRKMAGWSARMLAALMLVGVIGLSMVLRPDPAHARDQIFALECPQTQVREGESFDVYVNRSGRTDLGYVVRWHTEAGTAAETDYSGLDRTSQIASDSEVRNNRMKRTIDTNQDTLREGDETFTLRLAPYSDQYNDNVSPAAETCEITIKDDDGPTVQSISITSTPEETDTYSLGETIMFKVNFDTAVEVDGSVGMGIFVGERWDAAWHTGYARQPGQPHVQIATELVFEYTVKPGDQDTDGVHVPSGHLDDKGRLHGFVGEGSIKVRNVDLAASPFYNAISNQAGHKVDGSPPKVTKVGMASTPANEHTYRYGESIEVNVTFSMPVRVVGNPGISLYFENEGNASWKPASPQWRPAKYKSGSGTETLRFAYTVQPGDLDDETLHIGASGADRTGDDLVKARDHDVNANNAFVGQNPEGHAVDGRPYPKIIDITSAPSSLDTYGGSEVIQVDIIFDQPVDVGKGGQAEKGSFVLLEVGHARRQARYASGGGSETLAFEYTVRKEDRDDDGVSAFLPPGLRVTAKDAAVPYDPSPHGVLRTIVDDQAHKVDGSRDVVAPGVESVAFTSSPGVYEDKAYRAGNRILVSVKFTEPVRVEGSPQLEIDIGGVARTASFYDHRGPIPVGSVDFDREPELAVVFIYTVQEGDADSDGVSIGANKLSLNGGAIEDKANNAAILTHEAVADDIGQKVDAPDVTPPGASTFEFTSDPGDDDTYGEGDSIEVTVTFTEDVTVTGAPQLELDFDGTAKTAEYKSVSGKAVVFSYTVTGGDTDTDGVAIGENKLALNGGTIQDASENDAVLTHTAMTADAGHKVSAPGGL